MSKTIEPRYCSKCGLELELHRIPGWLACPGGCRILVKHDRKLWWQQYKREHGDAK
jgi:DNA-directed RNA polymerase subunit RPC12/RpoP